MVIINGGYKEYKLDNGLVVALLNTNTQTIVGKLRVNIGPYHEKEGEEGMAHFLEHCLVTSGSEKHNPQNADKIRENFGYFNASTSLGRISFMGKMLKEDLEEWLDYVSNHTLKPRFDKERIEEERRRVLREISDAKSKSTYSTGKEISDILYGEHPKGKFILGKEKIIQSSDIPSIQEFHSRGFYPNNMDLIIVGRLPKDIEELINECFGDSLRGNDTRVKFPEMKPLNEKNIIQKYTPERYNVDNPEESSAQLVLISTCPPTKHQDEYALKAIAYILGGGTHSLLFQSMSSQKGLAYSVDMSYNGYYNCGELNISVNVPANRINEAVDTIFEGIKKIKNEKVPNELINKIRKDTQFSIAIISESNEGYSSAIEIKLDEGSVPEDWIKEWNDITPERIQEVANKYLPNKGGNYILYIGNPLKKQRKIPI